MLCIEVRTSDLKLTKAERKNLEKYSLEDYARFEAAMCAYEHWVSENRKPKGFEEGWGQLRYCCYSLADAIQIGFIVSCDDQGDYLHMAYDWEFVPFFVENCVVWDDRMAQLHGTPNLVEDWLDRCRVHGGKPRLNVGPKRKATTEDLVEALNQVPNTSINHQHFKSTYEVLEAYKP